MQNSNNRNGSKNQKQKKLEVKHVQHASKQKAAKIGPWEEMVANPLSRAPVRTPSTNPFTGAVRTFVRTFDLKAADLPGDASSFDLIASPDLQDTLTVSAHGSVVIPTDYTLDGGSDWEPTGAVTPEGGIVMSGSVQIIDNSAPLGGNKHFIATQVDPSFGPYLPLVGTIATVMHFDSDPGRKRQVYYRYGGVWTVVATLEAHDIASFNITPLAPFDGVAFSIFRPTSYTGYSWVIEPGPGGPPPPTIDQATAHDAFSTDALAIGDLSEYRVTAMSVLCTYSGNMFNNGGVIAAARTRSGYLPTEASVYQSLTKLQDHSYRGALKDGAYAWYLPYDLDELDFRRLHHANNGTKLRIAGEFADESGSVQITLAMVVEFYSPLQIFEHEVGPALTDEFVKAYHRMDSLPAACCNPSHEDIVRVLGSIGRTAGSAASWLAKNPELVAMLLGGF